jgi:hypothetical protein
VPEPVARLPREADRAVKRREGRGGKFPGPLVLSHIGLYQTAPPKVKTSPSDVTDQHL